MVGVIEELRENDPARTHIDIRLDGTGEISDAALARALEQNPFVNDIMFNLQSSVQETDWDSLLRVIATRANLETVNLHGAAVSDWRIHATAVAFVRSILQALQQNSAIRTVRLFCLRLPTYVSTFVNTASSITKFELCDCDMDPSERQQGVRSLAVALQHNTSIETLELDRIEDIYAIPILEGLGSNVSLKTFVFSSTSFSDAASHALHQLLESTTSIQRFELGQTTFSDEQFCLIAQGIISSECISELRFMWCGFWDFAQHQSILHNKQNLSSLCLRECNFVRGQVHGDIISTLMRPDLSLCCFELYQDDLEVAFPGIHLKNLLNAIEKSKLERFLIGSKATRHYLLALTQSIPSMKLKELEIEIEVWDEEDSDDEDEAEGEFSRETIREDLLHAVKNNFSLQSVKAAMFTQNDDEREIDLFERAEDKHRLAFYSNRNESLGEWVDNPEMVDQRKVWPEVLSLAERAGPSALFRGLRSVLQSDYVSLPGKRKRKRPQRYAPA